MNGTIRENKSIMQPVQDASIKLESKKEERVFPCKGCYIAFIIPENTRRRYYCTKKCRARYYYRINQIILLKKKKIYDRGHRASINKRSREWYKGNRNKARLINKRRYIKNKEKRKAQQREYRRKNLEKVREADKKTYYKYKKHRDISPYGSKDHMRKLQVPKRTNGKFSEYLKSINLYHIPEFTPYISSKRFRADFFIPSMNLCIDIHSFHWHDYDTFPERKKEDEEKPIHFKGLGYDFKVIWEDELKNFKL